MCMKLSAQCAALGYVYKLQQTNMGRLAGHRKLDTVRQILVLETWLFTRNI
jgi:hypothetical protein